MSADRAVMQQIRNAMEMAANALIPNGTSFGKEALQALRQALAVEAPAKPLQSDLIDVIVERIVQEVKLAVRDGRDHCNTGYIERIHAELTALHTAPAAIPEKPQDDVLKRLFLAINNLLCHILLEDSIDSDHGFVLEAMDALHDIDGGVYAEQFAYPAAHQGAQDAKRYQFLRAHGCAVSMSRGSVLRGPELDKFADLNIAANAQS